MRAYNGKILFIDLSSALINEVTLPEEVYQDFIGGQGLGVRILYEYMKPGADPFGPDNILGFVIGPLTGTGVHGARFQVVGKSPITGGWGDSNCGGSFAKELKAAGYDAVFFVGIAPQPSYVFLNEGKVNIMDASHIWGKDTVETTETIKKVLGDEKVNVACIGRAGETRSFIAAVIHEGSAAARSGLAAVMGAKNLKAFAVRGTKKVDVAQPECLKELRKEYLSIMKHTDDEAAVILKKFGTCGLFDTCLLTADTPIKNWTLFGEEGFPTFANLDGESLIPYQTKKHGCLGCPVGCKGWVKVADETYGSFISTKVEYETLGMLGADTMVDDLKAVIKANDLCNRYGIDTISAGAVIAFAMELYELGIIDKDTTGGINLTWGNAWAMLAMLEKIGRREGFGAVLADGSKFAAERIGNNAEQYAMHVGGQDLPAHDPRVLLGTGWGYTLDATPARHTACEAANAFFSGIDVATYEETTFDHPDVHDVAANASLYAILSDVERLYSSAGVCQFSYYPAKLPIIDFINAATGWTITTSEGLKIGRRIATLRQAFNIREGVSTAEWILPERVSEPQSSGPNAGIRYDFKLMKIKGYQALGWDSETGCPLDRTLEGLDIKGLVGKLL